MSFYLMLPHKKDNIDLVCVISSLQPGGAQRVLIHLMKHWLAQGKTLLLITFADVTSDAFTLPEPLQRIVLHESGNSGSLLHGLMANIRRIKKLRHIFKQTQAKSILSFLTMTNILVILASRGLKAQVSISERNDLKRQPIHPLWSLLRRLTYRYADFITANSRASLNALLQILPEKKCRLVNNPVVILPSEPIVLASPTLLAVGRLHPQKAYDLLLTAFAQFSKIAPDWQLCILGDGALKMPLKKQAEYLGVSEKVQWLGHVEDPFPYYRAAQVYVLPSRYEGMPNALLEAMSCGMPSVISDALVGPLNFIEPEKTALTFPSGNANALAECLYRLATQPTLAKALSKAAQQSVLPYQVEHVMPEWEFVFS